MKKIKIGVVNYLNTKPLLYGIKNHPVYKEIELKEDYPARVAEMLLNNEVDIGLVPVVVLPQMKEYHIITDYCIGCDGEVASVAIFSDVPMNDIEVVFLDYQSRTSIMLAKILLKEYWKSSAKLIEAKGEDYIKEINGTTAGLIIGDRALEQRQKLNYIYDLGEAWKIHTSLPFVFAVWASNKKIPDDFLQQFNEANENGVKNMKEIIAKTQLQSFDLKIYFQKNISYILDNSKINAFKLFIQKIKIYNY